MMVEHRRAGAADSLIQSQAVRRMRPAVALVAPLLALFAPAPLPAAERLHEVVLERDVVYGKGGPVELKLDLARPKDGGPYPGLVCIHGGAWRLGDRRHFLIKAPWLGNQSALEYLAARGFVAVTVSYRLVPSAQFPAQIEDCKAAVRWLRANAAKYGVDPEHIAACGYSAGGHLACLLGVTDKADGLEGAGGHPEQSSKVQAVIDLFGPTDLTVGDWNPDVEDGVLKPLLGARLKEKPEAYRRASPLCYLGKDRELPPFLIMHGTRDPLVNINQSKKLAERLAELGAKYRFVEMKGEGHGWFGTKLAQTLDLTVEFLHENMKP
jgi:acetyl esterase/lipase